jgi:hypothetical protein
VRYYATETAQRLEGILGDMKARGGAPGGASDQLSSDFGQSASAALDKLF